MDVHIAGSDVSRLPNDDQLARITIELAAFDGEIGTGAFPLDDPTAADDYNGGRQFRVKEIDTTLVDGFIGDQDRARGPVKVVNREVVYSIQDPNALLFAKRAVRSRASETDVARVLAFAALDLSGVDTTWVLNTNTSTLAAKKYDGEGWAELISDLVAMTGKTLFIHDKASGGRCLHYHRLTEGHTSGLTITDAAGVANGITSFVPGIPEKQTSPADLGNDVKFVDQADRTATVTDATSITNHDADGLAHEKIIRVEAGSQAELDAIAASELLETKAERETWLCTIGPLDATALALIRAGDLITTTSQVMGLTAASKRIAHMSLTVFKGKDGDPMPGLWDARLELGAPIRRGSASKARSLPKPAPAPPPADPLTLTGTDLGTETWTDREYSEFISVGVAGTASGAGANPLIAQPTSMRQWDDGGFGTPGTVIGRTFVRHEAPAGAAWARLKGAIHAQRLDVTDPTDTSIAIYTGASGPWADGATPSAAFTDIGTIVWQRTLTVPVQPAYGGPFNFEVVVPVVDGHVQFVMGDVGEIDATPPQIAQWNGYMQAQGEDPGDPLKYELTFFGVASVNVGDVIRPVPVAIGDGTETIFTAPFPYPAGSLEVYVEGKRQVVTETDPETGLFTLAYAPASGQVVSVGQVVASTTQTAIPQDPVTRELGPVPGSGIVDVASANAAGTSQDYASEDHAHEGVHQITADGGDLVGNVTLAAGTSITIVRVGQTVTINSTGGGGGGASAWVDLGADSVQLDTGRIWIYDANGAANIGLDAGIYMTSLGDGIVLSPDGGYGVDIDTGEGLVLLRQSSDPTVLDDGQILYRSDVDLIRLRSDGRWVYLPWVAATGHSTITSGNTSIVVTHGAGFDPVDARGVQIFPTNNPTNDPGWFWVSNVGGTTFQINVRANPGASGASFAWRVVNR